MTTRNAHSMYLQIIEETGFLGLAFFVVCLLIMVYLAWEMYRFMRRQQGLSHLAILPITLVATTLVDGIVTSSGLGASPFAFMMALGIGLVDRLPELATLEKWQAFRAMQYARIRRPSRGRRGLGGLRAPG